MSPYSLSDREARQGDRPVLPPIRYLFGEELSRSPRRLSADIPSSPPAHVSYRGDDRRDDRTSQPSRSVGEPQPFRPNLLAPTPYPAVMGQTSTHAYPSYPPHPHSGFRHPSGYESPERVPFRSETYSSHSTFDPRASPTLRHPFRMAEPPRHAPGTVPTAVGPFNDERMATGTRYHAGAAAGIPDQADLSGLHMGGSLSSSSKYECSYCGKGFTRPSSLKIHVNSHTGEKPFICPAEGCGRSFSVLSNMRRHSRVHSQGLLKETDVPEEEVAEPQRLSSSGSSSNATDVSPTTSEHARKQGYEESRVSTVRKHSSSPSENDRPKKRSRHDRINST